MCPFSQTGNKFTVIKTHGSVPCSPRKWVCANGVSILTETTKSQFSCIRSSVMSYPNGTKFTMELASTQGRPHFKFEWDPSSHSWYTCQQIFFVFSSSFHTLCKSHYNSCKRVLILPKFCTHIGGIKANTCIDFGVNLFNIRGVISDFTHKQSRTSVKPIG